MPTRDSVPSDPTPARPVSVLPNRPGLVRRAAEGTSWLLRGGASLFIAFSVVSVAIAALALVGDSSGSVALYDATVRASRGDWVETAWGLTYDGVPGLLLALGQLAVVVGAVVMSRRSSILSRILAHGTLMAWATLWAANMFRLADVDSGFDAASRAMAMVIFLACTAFAAGRGVLVAPGRAPRGATEAAPLESAPVEAMPEMVMPPAMPSGEPALDGVPTLPLRAEETDATGAEAAPGRVRRGLAASRRAAGSCLSGAGKACRAAGSMAPAAGRRIGRMAGGVGRRVRDVARVAVRGVPTPAPVPVTEKAAT